MLPAIATLVAFATHAVWADHHHEAAVKKQVNKIYQLFAEGKFKALYNNMVHPDAIYFGPNGGLRSEFPKGEEKEKIIQQEKEDYENGDRVNLTPKHIEVIINDDGTGAIASYYVEGTIIENDDEEQVMDRISVVLVKHDGKWKAIHWHVSELGNVGNE